MLNKDEVLNFARNHTVNECCERFGKSYFCMYHYLRDHAIPFVKQPKFGCNNNNYKHGGKGTRLFHTWVDMRQRCSNPHNHAYKNYGGRGIKVCSEWESFRAFQSWALSNGYKEELTIDRIDVNGNYCPENCRWVNAIVQGLNRRNNRHITYKGQTKTLKEWAEIYNMHYDKLRWRLNNWSSLTDVFEK